MMGLKSRLLWAFAATVLIVFSSRPVSAQLTDVTWVETITLQVDQAVDSQQGPSDAAPEDINGNLVNSGYDLSGAISYVALTHPNAKAEVAGSYAASPAFSSLNGDCIAQVVFQIAVREISPPPVAVTTVPLRVIASGTSTVTGDGSLPAGGVATFDLSGEVEYLTGDHAIVNNQSGGSSASFALDTVVDVAVDEVLSGSFMARAQVITGSPQTGGASAGAVAEVDPIFEIGNQIIPGSSANYRDHYEIEYASGWWALGSVPAKVTTWGKIKRMYEAIR